MEKGGGRKEGDVCVGGGWEGAIGEGEMDEDR